MMPSHSSIVYIWSFYVKNFFLDRRNLKILRTCGQNLLSSLVHGVFLSEVSLIIIQLKDQNAI